MQSCSEEFPSACALKEALKCHINIPTVFKNRLDFLKEVSVNAANLEKKCGDTKLEFRIVSNSLKDIAWERNANYVEATISQFITWQGAANEIPSSNPFSEYKKDYWAYSSYNHMKFIFVDDSEIMKDINWSSFGFPEVTGKDSTFWLGSKGANTPCHMDSYGCNLVAQVLGRKKWVLFPPEDIKYLYPTRIPYEESSVFSLVNILDPDISQFPLFKKSHPHVVILEEGDVLFIPKGWWHFVLCLDDVTVSINTWIKLDSDNESRLMESVAKTLMMSLISTYAPAYDEWLNVNEVFQTPEETLNYIIRSLEELKKNENRRTPYDTISKKVLKTKEGTDVHSEQFCDIFKFKDILAVKPSSISTLGVKDDKSPLKKTSADGVTLNNIVNCFLHPNVINVICQLLKEI